MAGPAGQSRVTRLGIVTGLAREAACLTALAEVAGGRIVVRCAGADPARATAAAERLIADGSAALLSFGVAGGLDPVLRPGDMVIADEVVAADGSVLTGDPAWRDRLAGRLGLAIAGPRRIAGCERAVTAPAAKAALRQRTDAAVVDLESHAVAAVARVRGVPFLAVRAVIDPAGAAVPEWLAATTAADGSTPIAAVISGLARHPGDLPALIRLGRDFARAIGALRRVAVDAGPLFQLLR